MTKKPKCPECGKTEFTCYPLSMPNKDFWNPIICIDCGHIVGQLPSRDEKDGIEILDKILNVEEAMYDIKNLLIGFEDRFTKDTN